MTLALYHSLLIKNNIKLNPAQEEVLEKLADLNNRINLDENKTNKLLTKIKIRKQPSTKGIYLYGAFGTGKSMLVSLFFENLLISKKHRVHFYSFMSEIHDYLNKLKTSNKHKKLSDPLVHAAKYISSQFKLIYIDELQITDIADAMIVGKLFRELIKLKVIVIFTSNFSPNDLYKDGLQREAFLPFIELMEENLEIIKISSDFDYRQNKLKSIEKAYYIYEEVMDSQKFIYDCYLRLSNYSTPKNLVLNINSHELLCPVTSFDCAVFSFNQLCRAPLSSADYSAICDRFNTILISEIPKLSPEEHNEAKRFIALIDTIYEFKKIAICSAEVDIDHIYTEGKWSFEFKRTISRLHEMQSEEYSRS